MRSALTPFLLAALLACPPAMAEDSGMKDLMLIINAGGSLVINLKNLPISADQLAELAASLKYQSTLTIISGGALSAPDCAKIAAARPGQVVFWLDGSPPLAKMEKP